MEALTAVGFAANILQFVDSVSHVLKVGNQLRRNGMSDFNSDLERSATLLKHQVDQIRGLCGTAGVDEVSQALDRLGGECIEIANEITDFIGRFKIDRDTDPSLREVPKDREIGKDEIMYEQLKRLKDLDQERTRLKKRDPEQRSVAEQKPIRELDVEFGQLLTDELRELRQKDERLKALKRKSQNEYNKEERDTARTLKKELEVLKRKNFFASYVDMQLRNLAPIVSQEKSKFENERKRIVEANNQSVRTSKARRMIKTLAKAVESEWNSSKTNEFVEKLDRIRSLLDSEVMLNIQKSVLDIHANTQGTHKLLGQMSSTWLHDGAVSSQAMRENKHAVESVLEGFSHMEDAARHRHEAVIETINSFIQVLRSQYLFPTLPQVLTATDPSLKSAALYGYETVENAILAALYFPMKEDREFQVRGAHDKTCAWIFEEASRYSKPWTNFKRWLEEENGCYWIEGKAGCGKSTLMKFLVSDERTHLSLSAWAQPHDSVTASCFFWMAGSPLQKNEEGLLRCLLHTILTQRRGLISKVFPGRYNTMTSMLHQNNSDPDIFFSCDVVGCHESFQRPSQLETHRTSRHNGVSQKDNTDMAGPLTVVELRKAFILLSRQPFSDFKICLFVDGLDEYVGDQPELVELFRSVTTHPFLKAVLSSRPEPTFVEAFSCAPKLRVEDLTSGDMDLYVRSKLLSHSQMQTQMRRNPELGERLIHQILLRACGVFLWVFLVVRSLRQCLTDGSYPEELEGIIETYPPELHELYEHMFARMKPEHRVEAYKLFQAVFISRTVESCLPTALRFSYFERDIPIKSIKIPLNGISTSEIEDRLSLFRTRLRSRCCGLLEVQQEKSPNFKRKMCRSDEGKVAFLHRTVSDFLNNPGVREILERETSEFTPEIDERLLASILYRFKCRDYFRLKTADHWREYIKEIEAFLVYCGRCSEPKKNGYLEEFNKCLEELWQARSSNNKSTNLEISLGSPGYHWAESFLRERGLKVGTEADDNPQLSVAARYGFSTHACKIIRSMDSSRSMFFKYSGSLLATRLCCWVMEHVSLRVHYIMVLECLIEAGFELNTQTTVRVQILGRSPWEDLLYLGLKEPPKRPPTIMSMFGTEDLLDANDSEGRNGTASLVDRFEGWIDLVLLYVRSGADLGLGVRMSKDTPEETPAAEVVRHILTTVHSEEGLSSEELDKIRGAIARVEDSMGPRSTAKRQTDLAVSNRSQFASAICGTARSLSHGSVKQLAPVPAFSTTIDTSTRCRAVGALTELGFGLDQISFAIEKAGVGYDVAGLAAWILETSKMESKTTTQSEVKEPRQVRSNAGVRNSKVHTRQWSVVAKLDDRQLQKDVVGAQYIIQPKKQRRKTRTKSGEIAGTNVSTQPTDTGDSAGACTFDFGTFTWFFDPDEHSGGPKGLSMDQQNQLRDLFASFAERDKARNTS